ncbi:MAG: hypothetical protein R3D86_12135 [Emcibacteraceae bacterium]
MIKWIVTALFLLLMQPYSVFAESNDAQTGYFTMSGSLNSILGEDEAKSFVDLIDPNTMITWEIDVPENYDPANPPGVMVYVSPQNSVNIPNGWLEITRNRNLIFIGARESGNKVQADNRIVMSVMALPLIQKTYKINTNRIYISGFSGGGRIASIVSTKFPHIFNGALYNCGANFWEDVNDQRLNLIKSHNYVFLTGTKDFNLDDTKNVYAKYKKAGVNKIKLMVIPRMGHSNPKKSQFENALQFLDER